MNVALGYIFTREIQKISYNPLKINNIFSSIKILENMNALCQKKVMHKHSFL